MRSVKVPLLSGACVLAIGTFLLAIGAGAQEVSPLPSPSDDASALSTGPEYAAELGLVAHPWEPGMQISSTEAGVLLDGELLSDCPPQDMKGDVTVIKSVESGESGFLYCIRAESEIDAWVIGERLAGHVPTEAEVAAMEAKLAE